MFLCFRIDTITLEQQQCPESTHTGKVNLVGNYASTSQLFVGVGVTCFLYCIGAILVYVFFDTAYRSNATIPILVRSSINCHVIPAFPAVSDVTVIVDLYQNIFGNDCLVNKQQRT